MAQFSSSHPFISKLPVQVVAVQLFPITWLQSLGFVLSLVSAWDTLQGWHWWKSEIIDSLLTTPTIPQEPPQWSGCPLNHLKSWCQCSNTFFWQLCSKQLNKWNHRKLPPNWKIPFPLTSSMSCVLPFSWPLYVLFSLLVTFILWLKTVHQKSSHSKALYLAVFRFFFHDYPVFWQENYRKNWNVSGWEIIFYFKISEKKFCWFPHQCFDRCISKSLPLSAMKHKAPSDSSTYTSQSWSKLVGSDLTEFSCEHTQHVCVLWDRNTALFPGDGKKTPLSSYRTLLSCSCVD